MPHMSNLSWVYLFCTFNTIFLMFFCFMNISKINTMAESKNTQPSYKKWQW